MELPPGARKFGVQFRWWQPYHSGRGQDVWALDEITMTSVLFNTISLDFSNVLDVTQSLGFYLGHVQPYCEHDWTLRYGSDRFDSLNDLKSKEKHSECKNTCIVLPSVLPTITYLKEGPINYLNIGI